MNSLNESDCKDTCEFEGTSGARLIDLERLRQSMREGFSNQHDDCHKDREIARAAMSYLKVYLGMTSCSGVPAEWPWEGYWWKPGTDPIRLLTKTGALVAAEIDRLKRLENENKAREEAKGEGRL